MFAKSSIKSLGLTIGTLSQRRAIKRGEQERPPFLEAASSKEYAHTILRALPFLTTVDVEFPPFFQDEERVVHTRIDV